MKKPFKFNIDLHNKIIATIEANPKSWDQNYWHSGSEECGTSHCYAGFAQILSGKPMSSENANADAREALGLTKHESMTAFYLGNTLGFLKHLPKVFSYDKDGYNLKDEDCYGRPRHDEALSGFNRHGYDHDGFDTQGYDTDGFDRNNKRRPATT